MEAPRKPHKYGMHGRSLRMCGQITTHHAIRSGLTVMQLWLGAQLVAVCQPDSGAVEAVAARRVLALAAALLHVPALHAQHVHASNTATAQSAAAMQVKDCVRGLDRGVGLLNRFGAIPKAVHGKAGQNTPYAQCAQDIWSMGSLHMLKHALLCSFWQSSQDMSPEKTLSYPHKLLAGAHGRRIGGRCAAIAGSTAEL